MRRAPSPDIDTGDISRTRRRQRAEIVSIGAGVSALKYVITFSCKTYGTEMLLSAAGAANVSRDTLLLLLLPSPLADLLPFHVSRVLTCGKELMERIHGALRPERKEHERRGGGSPLARAATIYFTRF